jgi:hypothetical protein
LLGSVRQLADGGGSISLDRNYDPFGNLEASTGSGSSIFGFTGEQTDRSGMVYLRAGDDESIILDNENLCGNLPSAFGRRIRVFPPRI